MGFHSFDLQSAIFSGDNKIFDTVAPQDTAYPYVVIGTETSREVNTKDRSGRVYNVDIDVWSQYRGQKETKEIMEILISLLDNTTISVAGATSIVSQVVNAVTLVEGDGITRHGIVNVDFLIYD